MKTSLSVRIMDSDYQLMCDAQEKAILEKGSSFLNRHLKEFRQTSPSMEMDKVVVMGALRAVCELVSNLDKLSDQAKISNGEINKALEKLG